MLLELKNDRLFHLLYYQDFESIYYLLYVSPRPCPVPSVSRLILDLTRHLVVATRLLGPLEQWNRFSRRKLNRRKVASARTHISNRWTIGRTYNALIYKWEDESWSVWNGTELGPYLILLLSASGTNASVSMAQAGVSVQQVTTTTDIGIPSSNDAGEPTKIPAGS